MSTINRKQIRQRLHQRVRRKISGTVARPRLAVFFSNKNVYAQVIDDTAGVTLASASTKEAAVGESRANAATAAKVGKLIAERALDKKVGAVVFDRGGFAYGGKVKALADAAREAGLKF